MQARDKHLRRSIGLFGVLTILVSFGVDFAGFVLVANERHLAASGASLALAAVPVPTPPIEEQPYVLATPAPAVPAAQPMPELVAVPTPPLMATVAAPLQAERPLTQLSTPDSSGKGRWLVVGVIAPIIIGLLAWLRRASRITFKHSMNRSDSWATP